MRVSKGLGPLTDGSRVIVVGGGPSGAAVSLALKKLARESGRRIHVTLFEGKTFAGEKHFNQCVGVLSSPIEEILEEHLGVPFPITLVQNRITGYILHSDRRSIALKPEDDQSRDYAVRRIQFDEFLLERARAEGVQINTSRVTDLEFGEDHVTVFSENANSRADVVIGAFGLDGGTSLAFQRACPYQPPRSLSSIVTKFHPGPDFMNAFGKSIHAFLPSTRSIEFAGVTPKGNHLTINIAGKNVESNKMDVFLHSKALLSLGVRVEESQGENDLTYFKGQFPVSPASAFYGDRYVIVGDAAGLVRPFKGKGVNSALRSGAWAAESMMTTGISRLAFRNYHRACREITGDLLYGKVMRIVAITIAKTGLLDSVLALAEHDARLRGALFDAVSARNSYRSIVLRMIDARWIIRMLLLLAMNGFRPGHKIRRTG